MTTDFSADTPSANHDPLPKVWDENARIGDMLKGKRGLVVGVANGDSIAFGCAAKLRAFGAEIRSPTSTTRPSPMSSRWRSRLMPMCCCRWM